MPAVSVILPVFNGEKFLAEAIDSVCGQTLSDWELIIVDDGSADRSGAVADRYSMNDRRIRVIHAPNGGLSVARNRGIDAARSPWIYFLDADDAVRPLADRYFCVCIWGAPAVLATYVLNGWLLGMQNTRLPMAVAVTTNVVNIALSLTFVYGFGMRIEGVALGTLLAQWTGAVIFRAAVLRKYRPRTVARRRLLDPGALRRLFSINTDIFLRTLCLVAVTVWFTRAGAMQSVSVLAANALLMQLFMFFSYFSDGFAYAGEALAGKAHGAADRAGLRLTVRALLQWGGAIALAFTAIYFVAGEAILRLLTDDGDVIDTALEYLPWAVSVPACGILAFVYDGIFIGLTATRRMLASIALSAAVFFAAYALAFPTLGNHGLWLAFLLYLLIRGLFLAATLTNPTR